MNWRSKLIRAVGATNPFTAPLVQLQSDIDAARLEKRLEELEDPISHLHPDLVELSHLIYEKIRSSEQRNGNLEGPQYEAFRRALALLEGDGLITGSHAIGSRFAHGFRPSTAYLLYMAALFEEPGKMDDLVERVDCAEPGEWIRGEQLAQTLELPLPVVRAVFEAFESRGLGLLSKEVGTANYRSQA